MKSSKMKITVVLLLAICTLAGCGEKLYELTPEEEAAIVSYAAQAVAKFNGFQPDGEVFLKEEDLKADGDVAQDSAPSDTQAAEQDTETAEQTPPQPDGQGSQTDTNAPQAAESTATIGESLDLGVVQAEYIGNSLCTTYEKSDSFAVDAEAGKQLLVLTVKLTNPTAQDLHIDILSMKPSFQAIVNGTESAMAQTTILPNDLSTYQGDLLAGASNETVLLFQIPQELQEISSLQLRITMNGSQNTVNL